MLVLYNFVTDSVQLSMFANNVHLGQVMLGLCDLITDSVHLR